MTAPAQPHPRPVDSSNCHEVWQWIDQGVAKRTFKRCAHLSVDVIQEIEDKKINKTFFIPVCTKQSFIWRNYEGFTPNNEQQEVYLMHQLQSEPIRCPVDCVHDRSARLAKFWDLVKEIGTWMMGYLAAPFRWFAKLPAAQVSCVSHSSQGAWDIASLGPNA